MKETLQIIGCALLVLTVVTLLFIGFAKLVDNTPVCTTGNKKHSFGQWQTHRAERFTDSTYQFRSCTNCGWTTYQQ